MMSEYINITKENLAQEHLCCAIGDKKHEAGVAVKKDWLSDRLEEGHTFRKLNTRGKVFIEYAPLESAWVPVEGDNYLYIYCLWVSGSFKNKGHGRDLIQYCINEARRQNKSGVCVLTNKKKTPFLADRKFVQKYGFETVETLPDGYELMALSLDGTLPRFAESVKQQPVESAGLTIYYGRQCPFIVNGISQVQAYCSEHQIPLNLVAVDSLAAAKQVPCIFNNWAVFYQGKFKTVHMLNEGYLKKLLSR